MIDLNITKEYYNNAPTTKLLELVNNLVGLDQRVIPLLLSELEKRQENIAVERIKVYLNSADEKDIPGIFDCDSIRQEINERLSNGENIESIKIDLKDRIGITNYNLYIGELARQDTLDDDQYIYATTNVLHMQEQNLSEEEILNHLKSTGISEKASEIIINKSIDDKDTLLIEANLKLKRRTERDLFYGPIILVVGLGITITTLIIGEGSFYIIAYGSIIVGIARIIRGYKFKGAIISPGDKLTDNK